MPKPKKKEYNILTSTDEIDAAIQVVGLTEITTLLCVLYCDSENL